MRSRLQQLVGPVYPWLSKPHLSGQACLLAWILSLPFTWQHPWIALLGFIAIWMLTLAVWFEQPLLQALPLPPLTVLLMGLCLRWGIGPLLLAAGGSGGNSFIEIWIRHGLPAQALWMTFTAILLLISIFNKSVIASANTSHSQCTWLAQALTNPRLKAQLRVLAFLLSIYMALYIVLSLLSGAFDRQFDAYLSWSYKLWRLDTPVAAFSRLRDIWFLLFPLWWKLFRKSWRMILGIELLSFIAIALISGSRGLLFYPLILLLCGLWFIAENPRIIRYLATSLLLFVILAAPLIYVARDSSAYQNASSWTGRISAIGQVISRPDPILEKARWFGRDLYACHDPYLFTPENRDLPLATNENLQNLIYIWIPKHIMPNQPVIFDGHLIAKKLGRASDNTWTNVWFPCFSFPADLMRRWSFPGLLLGSFLVASFIHLIFRFWYRTASFSGSTFQVLLLLLPATYLQSFPFGTVLETAWALLWELPKYIILFWLLGAVVDRYLLPSKS